jgi:uncharacterized protein (DUF1330 family)
MSFFFLAQIQIEDETEYQKYLSNADQVFGRYAGEYLAVDDAPVCIEGKWNPGRIVLIRFESEADFKAWYHSDGYQRILKYRLHAATCNAIVFRGSS